MNFAEDMDVRVVLCDRVEDREIGIRVREEDKGCDR
jgi:hypothetical protein